MVNNNGEEVGVDSNVCQHITLYGLLVLEPFSHITFAKDKAIIGKENVIQPLNPGEG